MAKPLEIRTFDVREADWHADRKTLSEIRRLVFIVEQEVPKEEEWDGRDEESRHWLATDPEGRPIGTARMLPDGQIGRMAVIGEFRGLGVGAALLDAAVEKARHLEFQSVYLNAQSHALDFYQKQGFAIEGDEFMEAGIPHYRMTRELPPLADEAQRVSAAATELDVSIRAFDAAEVEWERAGKIIRTIRQSVLVRELGLGQEMVTDDEDSGAFHWQAVDNDEQVIGAIRMNLDGVISRLAVMEHHRKKGVGHSLLELAVGKATRFGYKEVTAMALTDLEQFYRTAGFEPRGEKFVEQGLEHQEYFRTLEYEDVFDRPRTSLVGDDYGDVIYRLGQDNRLLLLRKEEEFRNVILEMARQATQSIRIFSPLLDHKLYDSPEMREICSALARRNKYTRVEILVYDPHRIIKNGHALLEISRRLPSSIGIKIVDPELRQFNHEFVVVDDYGLIYRHDYEIFDGYANFYDMSEGNRYARSFRSAWESGLLDPNLRQMRL